MSFLVLGCVTALLGVVWLTGNVRSVPADSNAIVMRYGRVVSVRHSGLVAALPRPFETVSFLPSSERQISLHVSRNNTDYSSDETDLELQESDDFYHMEKSRDAANSSYLLTGDGNVVRLDANVFYRIIRPVAYMQSRAHVTPALKRIFYAAATDIAATHPVEDFLVVHSQAEAGAGNEDLSSRRAALRGELLSLVNARLAALKGPHADLGIEVARIDLGVVLPPRAKEAFDQVLTAEQSAAQNVAAARTEAERILQAANREHDRLTDEAAASAVEFVHAASEQTASISAVDKAVSDAAPTIRQAVGVQAWRDRAAALLGRVGQVTAVAPGMGQVMFGGPVPDRSGESGQGEGSTP
nr:SPFH domain-containing protein [Acetobacter estunensis]